ncbi:hypothetical protein LNTAR_16953 [Lentisphaera araneosa HTCC2155]|uniref:Right handed beta helix domain-containing protein n=1 Tax=Lentisphaera araneosa HTCC2155 TaxID=313628 RepID=A6DF79_9BACT|nr:right-handed parallel beta-helix repeat-containing protein [Lentisphaera araneosa]EDM29459.1 hypothetical protein LNTAR_16953 [Lentisphaera araneosa HTCC2155]
MKPVLTEFTPKLLKCWIHFTDIKPLKQQKNMKKNISIILLLLFGNISLATANDNFKDQLKAADALFSNSRDQAQETYRDLLDQIPGKYEPFRSLIILRLAYTTRQADRMKVLKHLDQLTYVPEHHALAAKEMIAEIEGKNNHGHQRTAIPLLPKVDVTIDVSLNGKIDNLGDALIAARKAKSKGKSVEIVLASGTYLQKETLELNEQDTGLIIRSADTQNPAIISGGLRLKKWSKELSPAALNRLPESSKTKVLACDIKANGADEIHELLMGGVFDKRPGTVVTSKSQKTTTSLAIPELFYKGEAQGLARWPNDKTTKLPINKKPKKANPYFKRWNNESDLWLHGYFGVHWADTYQKFERVHRDGKITVVPPDHPFGFKLGDGQVVNALCELDQPGEWHFDSKNNLIHYLPPSGFDPTQCVLSSFGTPIIAKDCDNLQIRDLNINYTRGDAMIMLDCDNLLIKGVNIEHCSGYGLKSIGGIKQLIHSCKIASMGCGGLIVKSGDSTSLTPGHSIIENCQISGMSRINRTYTPALNLNGMAFKVRHNLFLDIPSSALSFQVCDTLVELNTFRNCVYESGDQGAIDIYANPLARGNIIRWNLFDDIIAEHQDKLGAAGIRLDDYVSGFMISENIFRMGGQGSYGMFFGAVQINKGWDNYIEGNIIIDWPRAVSGRTGVREMWDTMKHHKHTQQRLKAVDWKSEAWQKKYPRVRDIMDREGHSNYLADNQQFGTGDWHGVANSMNVANIRGPEDFHGESLNSIKYFLSPWHQIPVDLIGPYDERSLLK